jgi:hypothetical protein
MERDNIDYELKEYDIIAFKDVKASKSAETTIVIIKDKFRTVKTGIKSKIGNPHYYDD